MVAVVAGSNVAVQYPINEWLTWGAFTYPFAFLVTDLTNRRLGPARARWCTSASRSRSCCPACSPRRASRSRRERLPHGATARHPGVQSPAPPVLVAGAADLVGHWFGVGHGRVLRPGVRRDRPALGHLGVRRSRRQGGRWRWCCCSRSGRLWAPPTLWRNPPADPSRPFRVSLCGRRYGRHRRPRAASQARDDSARSVLPV